MLDKFRKNLPLNTDSYKASMFLQYPPGTEVVYSYIESRGGVYDATLFFGLQAYIKEYLLDPVTKEQVEYAKEFWAAHGEPFNYDGWMYIVNELGGKLPLSIKAVPEGLVIPVKNVLAVVENTDPKCFWLTTWVETSLLRAVWYGVTVATQSYSIKKVIQGYLEETGDVAGLPFKLHDFGARGVSSFESAVIGDMGHLAAGFMGTDTVSGILGAREYYGEMMAGFSIPAAEHSTITSWGRENEVKAYANMLKQFAKPGALVAVVSDSYDILAACDIWGTTLKQQVIDSGAVVIIRPDSGHPETVVLDVVRRLDSHFGSVVNAKGYKVLNNVRVIQGDGINEQSIRGILMNLKFAGYSADNVAFGMGGALLQIVNRDTQMFAMKCSAIRINGKWFEVYKDPVGDSTKKSKRGRVTLTREGGEYKSGVEDWMEPVLKEVYRNGELLIDYTFAEVRANSSK
jgi:nicotinamide phosphoribosyltransferase